MVIRLWEKAYLIGLKNMTSKTTVFFVIAAILFLVSGLLFYQYWSDNDRSPLILISSLGPLIVGIAMIILARSQSQKAK